MRNSPNAIRFERPSIREEYTEFTTGGETIAVITDPETPTAWIRSSVTANVEP